jgi:hypothetical protein
MKSVFKFAGRLGEKLPSIFLGCLLAASWVANAQEATFISPAIVGNPPPNVNATNFINAGAWNINTSPLPYQTFSTYNYTNSSTMIGSIGWDFSHGPYPNGVRGWAANFVNGNGGVIAALDGSAASGLFITTVSYLLISATNIVNQGTLTAGSFGKIVVQGSGVNLSRSGLEITPVVGVPNGLVNFTNFIPDTAIYDQYWFGGTNTHVFDGTQIWNGAIVGSATFFNVGEPCGGLGIESIGPLAPSASGYLTNNYGPFQLITTNSTGGPNPPVALYSNLVRQAIFVSANDPNISAAVGFGFAISPTNIFRTMAAQLAATSTNIVTQALQTSYVYVVDDLASLGTNGALAQNLFLNPSAICTDPTYRPDSVIVSRSNPGNFTSGSGSIVPPTFFYDPSTFSNSVSVGRADAYSALVDNLAAEPISGFALSNAPGKIIINARDLNLSKVRISSGVEVLIQASNLVSSAGAAVDCQNLSYNFGSTNGLLNITNLSFKSVNRLNGTVNEWSGLWTNYIANIYTNYILDPTSTNVPNTTYVRSDVTNVTEVDLAITVVDAGGLATTIPVFVQNLVLHSTNMIVSDVMAVTNTLLFDGLSLTIQGGISLANPNQGWSSALAPTLRYFTNNGVLQIPNSAHFGDDGATNYAVFVNTGTITAGNEKINSDVFQSGGSQTVSAGFVVTTLSGKVENGSINSGQEIQFTAGTLKLNNAALAAGDQLYFYVTGSLFDAGGSSGNVLTCTNGFDLPVKPATGDLLGTALETTTPIFAAVDHSWSGLDLGNSTLGYTNNEAVGRLILNEGIDTEFLFHATSSSNALYADLLDLSQCPDFLDPDVLTIDPNFVIYYAAIKLPSTFAIPPNSNGVPQEAEEYMNGQLSGHLIWVPGFAGPNSSVDVLINGATAQVNKALRYSKIIDSNGNGIPNYYDANPFNPALVLSGSVVQTNLPPSNKFAISWTAAANTIYQVQYSTNYSSAVWLPLLSYTNGGSTSTLVKVWDTNAMSGQRFYRVSHP